MPRGASSTNDRRNDKNNRVRRERIVDGTDVRTTVMLRNIPNKLDWVRVLLHLRVDACQLTPCTDGS